MVQKRLNDLNQALSIQPHIKEIISRFGFKLKYTICAFSWNPCKLFKLFNTASYQRNQFKYFFCSGWISKPSTFTYKFNFTSSTRFYVICICAIVISKNVNQRRPFCIFYILAYTTFNYLFGLKEYFFYSNTILAKT